MRKSSRKWFAAFVATFAAAAACVFWGTWSLDMVPVMPDCPASFPVDYVEDWLRGWHEDGKFIPSDLIVFLGDPYFWVELRYVFATFCAALGMGYFLRGRGLTRAASYGAGLFLAFSGYWLTLFSAGHLGWFQWMTYGVFAFGLIDRAIGRRTFRHWVLLGACVAWGSFRQPDLWLLFTVFTGCYFIYRFIRTLKDLPADAGDGGADDDGDDDDGYFPRPPVLDRRVMVLGTLKGCAVALAVFVVIGLPSFRSAIFNDLAGREAQMERGETTGANAKDDPEARWKFVTNWSMPPEDTLEFFWPRIHGDTSCPMTLAIGNFRGNGIRPYTGRLGCPMEHEKDVVPEGGRYPNYRQHSLYVGLVTCLLALFAVASLFRKETKCRADIIFFSVSALVFWLFSMGRYCEAVYRVVYHLPMGDYMRAPVKWHHLTEFCLVALAGFGLDRFIRSAGRKIGPGLATLAGCAVILVNVSDLAARARLYCAPHHADTNLAPITQQPIPEDPVQAARFLSAVEQSGLVPVGKSKTSVELRNGSVREVGFLWVEQKAPRPEVRSAAKSMSDGAFTLAAISMLASGLVVGYVILFLAVRRVRSFKVFKSR